MTKKRDYSKIRGLLTIAIRHLQLSVVNLVKQESSDLLISEVEYWITSLELVRNCLYDCDSAYEGQLDLYDAIHEVKTEITDAIKTVKRFDILSIKYLDKVWSTCKELEGLLK